MGLVRKRGPRVLATSSWRIAALVLSLAGTASCTTPDQSSDRAGASAASGPIPIALRPLRYEDPVSSAEMAVFSVAESAAVEPDEVGYVEVDGAIALRLLEEMASCLFAAIRSRPTCLEFSSGKTRRHTYTSSRPASMRLRAHCTCPTP